MMSTEQDLMRELRSTPESLLSEVLDYVRYLKSKSLAGEARVTALASQEVLAKDWLSPEEDEAWKDLPSTEDLTQEDL